MTEDGRVSVASLQTFLLSKKAIDFTREYARNNVILEKYGSVFDAVENEVIIGACLRLDHIDKAEKSIALKMILTYFETEDMLSVMQTENIYSERFAKIPSQLNAMDKISEVFGIEMPLYRKIINKFKMCFSKCL